MIKKIIIENFILIDKKEISFTEGLNVLTGETGHGKSILLRAILLLFQGNISKKYIRNNKEKSKVFGEIQIDSKTKVPKELKKKYNIGELITIERIFDNKKSLIKINNVDSSLSELEFLGRYLSQSLTQFQKFELLKPERQLEFIDELILNNKNLVDFNEKFHNYKKDSSKLSNLKTEFNKQSIVIEYKKEQFEQLSSLDINEDDLSINEKLNILENFDISSSKLSNSYNLLNPDTGLFHIIRELKKELLDFNKDILDSINLIESNSNILEHKILSEIEFLNNEKDSLDELILRFNQLKPFLKKHNNSIKNLFNHYYKLSNEINNYEELEVEISSLEKSIQKKEQDLILIAKKISKERIKVSRMIEKSIINEFKLLNLKDCTLKIEIDKVPLTQFGIDSVNFLIKTNAGGNFYPLQEIVSGGELSRIMFSLLNIKKASNQILCFDEVDSGIGGKTSILLSKKIKEISKNNQIICITHSPSIAVIANNHINVQKETNEKSTISNFNSLDNNLILEEIARMLGYDSNKKGLTITKEFIKELIHQIEG